MSYTLSDENNLLFSQKKNEMVSSGTLAKNWFLTVPNYTPNDISFFETIPYGDKVLYAIVGKEVGEGGLEHLQAVIRFKSKLRFRTVKTFLTLSSECHLECCRNVAHSIIYCKKEGNFTEYGDLSLSGSTAGKRTDLEEFKEAVKAGEYDIKSLMELHSEVFARYHRFCLSYIDINKPIKPVEEHDLMAWQTILYELLQFPPNDRTIYFVVDFDGNNGKTWFAHWIYGKLPNVQVIPPGKKNDMVFALDESIGILFVDCPRSKQGEYIQYDFLEEVKNGYIFSPKYESRVKRLSKCHVVVLMNEDPDMTKLSEDRYHIIKI